MKNEKDGITHMSSQNPAEESAFHARVDAVLARIEAVIDEANSDIDCDCNGGILTLTFANDSKVIVNRQTPNREIWVAAKSGGFHFKWHAVPQEAWRDTRSGETLALVLTRVISAQAEEVISVTL